MNPVLKGLYSPDIEDLESYHPPDAAFEIYVQLFIGPSSEASQDTFGLVICSPKWLEQQSGMLMGRGYLITSSFRYNRVIEFINRFLSGCGGEDWDVVACKVSRLAQWEFEDYQPYEPEGEST